MAGKTAAAVPARSAMGSPPPTRMVLRVATVGKPSFAAAWLWEEVGADVATPVAASSLPPLPIEQPARARVASRAALRMGADLSRGHDR